MKNFVFTITLVVLALTGAVLEGLLEGFPAQLVQINGILVVICAAVYVVQVLKVRVHRT